MLAEAHDFDALRVALMRFARMQLRNDTLAEDVVSETLLALVEKPQAFAGQSSLRTFATGILKHKILDQFRRGKREVALDTSLSASHDGEASDTDVIEASFASDGHWVDAPSDWGDPDAQYQRREFFEVLQLCVDQLPARSARLFMMREWLELEIVDICQQLDVSASNCSVMLFRARLQLRECLQVRWVGDSA
jgi:RNA polymerase sigma-70 factor (ECF subfamily)